MTGVQTCALPISDDIYRVPTFIKYPAQTSAAVSDCATSNLDLLPTINAVLNTETSWKFAGKALNGDCPSRTSRVVHSITGEKADMTRGFEATKERAEYYAGVVSNVGPASRIAAVGKDLPVLPGAEILRGEGRVVIPGMVNTHHHLYQTMFRNVPGIQDAELFPWLKMLYPLWRHITPRDVHVAALTGLGEVPRIAGLQPVYIARQLITIKNGTSNGTNVALMKKAVANLTEDDIIAISAYLGTLPPR